MLKGIQHRNKFETKMRVVSHEVTPKYCLIVNKNIRTKINKKVVAMMSNFLEKPQEFYAYEKLYNEKSTTHSGYCRK